MQTTPTSIKHAKKMIFLSPKLTSQWIQSPSMGPSHFWMLITVTIKSRWAHKMKKKKKLPSSLKKELIAIESCPLG